MSILRVESLNQVIILSFSLLLSLVSISSQEHFFIENKGQVFDQNGKWIYSFGSKGNKQGQFMGPEGIDINDNGDIVVLDKGNNRLQVFTSET